jgi:tetratricopeptide (TPR) repeat protein
MSLLMKALEKAAKDREETGAESTPAAATAAVAPGASTAKSELTLEPIAPQPAAPRERSLSPRKTTGAAPAAPAAAASRESAQAATVIRAGQRETGGGAGAYAREHPLFVFGTLVALFLLAYGSYVYLQITNPGMFAKQPARPAQSAPIAPAPAASGGTVTAEQPPVAITSLLPPMQEGAEKDKSAPAGAAVAPAAPAAAAAPAPPAVRNTIEVTVGGARPTVNPLLTEAYTALNAGDLESSQRLYNQLLISEPGNFDALLGLAAIAMQQGDNDQATRHYLKLLELDPSNALAQAGLIGMLGRADPLAAETRVKQLIARDPSAFLYFTLGNAYADQTRWPDAQQAYFQAHHLQPDNPDYAYNLAVGLEHIGQPKPALDFYRRARQLAAAKGRANFSTAAAQERISKLEKVVE